MQSKLPYLLLGCPLALEFLDEFVTVDVVCWLPGVILVTITLPLQKVFNLKTVNTIISTSYIQISAKINPS